MVQPWEGVFGELLDFTGGGVLYQPNEPERLGEAIKPLLLDPAKARELGGWGRETVLNRFNPRTDRRRTGKRRRRTPWDPGSNELGIMPVRFPPVLPALLRHHPLAATAPIHAPSATTENFGILGDMNCHIFGLLDGRIGMIQNTVKENRLILPPTDTSDRRPVTPLCR